jgi:hypothetical protein
MLEKQWAIFLQIIMVKTSPLVVQVPVHLEE